MSFGSDEHSGYAAYEINTDDSGTEIGFFARFEVMTEPSGGTTEVERDAAFQTILDFLATMPNVIILSSNKNGRYVNPGSVTP
jgi:hypothetical protein